MKKGEGIGRDGISVLLLVLPFYIPYSYFLFPINREISRLVGVVFEASMSLSVLACAIQTKHSEKSIGMWKIRVKRKIKCL